MLMQHCKSFSMCVVTCVCGGPRNEDNCVPGMNVASVHTCLDAEFWLYVRLESRE